MRITRWRRIDEAKQTLRLPGQPWAVVTPVLRTNVNGRILRQRALRKYSPKLGAIVLAEEYRVVRQREALRAGERVDRDGGKRALRARRALHRSAHFGTEKSPRDGVTVRVAHHRINGQLLAAAQLHGADPAVRGLDLRDAGPIMDPDAQALRELRHLRHQAVHSALHIPHARLFYVRNEHQGGRAGKRGGSAVGRVACKQLPQAWVFEKIPGRIPERFERPNPRQGVEVAEPHATRQAKCRRSGGEHEGFCKGFVDAVGMGDEAAVSQRFAMPRKFGDGLRGFLSIGEQIQLLAGGPDVPREKVCPDQRYPVAKMIACVGEQLIKDVRQGEDGRPCVEGRLIDGHLANFPSGRGETLEQVDIEAAACKIDGASESPDSRSDDGDPTRF